jgi:hypothetical protein
MDFPYQANLEMLLKLRFLLIAFLVAMGMGGSGCHTDQSPPAPLGDRATLDKLASAYETLSGQLPVSPSGLTPQGKLKFVQKVFKLAGYDFNTTLQALAQTSPENLSPYHKDMMDLVLLPNQGLSEQATQDLYSASQLTSIKIITSLHSR